MVSDGRRIVKYGLEIENWAFWSPESRVPAEWRDHWSQPAAGPRQTKAPDDAIPAVHRRRMSGLSKIAVQVAIEASRRSPAEFLVFCSQHGELIRTHELLGQIVAGIELSPAAFSQSVHNTSAGLYTIVTQNHAPASSLASGASTFAYGWLEAEGFLLDNPSGRALLVTYEDVLPEAYRPFSKQRQCMYAVGLMLRRSEHGGLTLESAEAEDDEPLPLAPLFMAWWLSSADEVHMTADGQGWTWRRHGS